MLNYSSLNIHLPTFPRFIKFRSANFPTISLNLISSVSLNPQKKFRVLSSRKYSFLRFKVNEIDAWCAIFLFAPCLIWIQTHFGQVSQPVSIVISIRYSQAFEASFLLSAGRLLQTYRIASSTLWKADNCFLSNLKNTILERNGHVRTKLTNPKYTVKHAKLVVIRSSLRTSGIQTPRSTNSIRSESSNSNY